jgi:hypothetical protein
VDEAACFDGFNTSSRQSSHQFYLGLHRYAGLLILQAIAWTDLDDAHVVVGYCRAWRYGEGSSASRTKVVRETVAEEGCHGWRCMAEGRVKMSES